MSFASIDNGTNSSKQIPPPLRAFVVHRRWSELAAATQYQYRLRLRHELSQALALSPLQSDGVSRPVP
ncbi:hypothetical protein [Chamaesiphon sp.]|uniref:hypothetical protein n=1 Tax=Chamaesiphon sp. TaxID=2814140 RepID=UPI003594309E